MITFLDLIKKLLETITKLSIPPTWISRTLFMFTSNIAYGMSFISDIKFIDKFFENVNNLYSCDKIKISKCDTNFVIIYLSVLSLKLLNNDLKSDYLEEFINIELESQIINCYNYQIFINKNYKLIEFLKNNVSEYYDFRNKDSWKDSNKPIDLPNGNYTINPNKLLDLEKINNYKSWCPLDGQQMIGSKWGEIPGLIEQLDFDLIESDLIKIYEKINLEEEAKEVLDISLNLNEEQKCIAEFWAGIGGSVAPPGFWNIFMLCCFEKSNNNDYFLQLKYFYELNCGLFQVSIIIWNIKYKCLQARPIQTIRFLFPNSEFDYYFGNGYGKSWLPYQESRLWTPSFCDFLSGHSAFSAVGAFFMTKFFGSNVTDLGVSINSFELKLLSPIFKNYFGNPLYLSDIILEKGCSNIEENIPNQQINLKFNTWKDMAESAGISRIYGGIHYRSSNLISLDIGTKVASLINKKCSYN